MAGTTVNADLTNDGQDQVLRADAFAKLAGNVNSQRFWFALQQTLRRQDVTHFSCADAEGEGAECPVRAGVAVTANNGLAGLGGTELRTNNMDNAAVFAVKAQQLNAKLLAVRFHLSDLIRRAFADNGQVLEAGHRCSRC